jgi:preprotein translocase subunit SecF
MQILKDNPNFNFMNKRLIAAVFSVVLVMASIVSLVTQGLNFGLDFTGGTMIELDDQDEAKLDDIRSALEGAGYERTVVQNFGSIHDVLIRLPAMEDVNKSELSNNVVALLQAQHGTPIDVRRVEFVGPQVGEELTEQGSLAMLYALIGILIYVSLRFEYRFAIGSVVALVHDVIITLGAFSIMQLDFDLTVLAAILAIIGYSLNDTIVVFDRIRESFLRMRKGEPHEIVNSAINDTLSRTIMTSFTTVLVVLALFVFGGEVIHDFAIALLIGIVVGTYSSIYIASNAVLAMGVSKADLLPPEKDENQQINEDGSQV